MTGAIFKIQPRLTAHAALRYVQRVRGIDLGIDEDDFGTVFALELHLFAARLTFTQIEAVVLTSGVLAAIRGGASRIRAGTMSLVVRGQNVVTIEPLHRSLPAKKFKQISRREAHRENASWTRRLRRAPA